jgi:hypothetical protein
MIPQAMTAITPTRRTFFNVGIMSIFPLRLR